MTQTRDDDTLIMHRCATCYVPSTLLRDGECAACIAEREYDREQSIKELRKETIDVSDP